jgi:hypothetical protein
VTLVTHGGQATTGWGTGQPASASTSRLSEASFSQKKTWLICDNDGMSRLYNINECHIWVLPYLLLVYKMQALAAGSESQIIQKFAADPKKILENARRGKMEDLTIVNRISQSGTAVTTRIGIQQYKPIVNRILMIGNE